MRAFALVALVACGVMQAQATRARGLPADRGLPLPSSPLEQMLHDGVHPPTGTTKHHFHHKGEDGREVFLRYEVEHAPGVFALDEHEPIESITCTQDALNITFTHAPDQHHEGFREGALLVGGFGWGCVETDRVLGGKVPKAILRRVKSIFAEGSALIVSTVPARPHEFFKNADIEMRTNHFPHTMTPAAPAEKRGRERAPQAASRRLSPDAHEDMLLRRSVRRRLPSAMNNPAYGNQQMHRALQQKVLSNIGHAIKHVADDIGDAVKKVAVAVYSAVKKVAVDAYDVVKAAVGTVVDAVKFIFTGAINIDKAVPLVSLDTGTHTVGSLSASDGLDVGCTAAASAKLTANFVLKVSHYKLQHIEVSFTGTAAFDVEAVIGASAAGTYSKSPNVGGGSLMDKKLFEAFGKSFFFAIGPIPFHVALTMPVYHGYDVSIGAGDELRAKVHVEGTVEYGVQVTRVDGDLVGPTWINKHSFTHTGGILKPYAAAAVLSRFYIEPTLLMKIDYIGGPYVALRPTVGLSAVPSGDCGGMSWSLDAALSVGFGASIDITLPGVSYNKDWASQFMTFLTVPISKGCLKLPEREATKFAPTPTGAPTIKPTPAPTAAPTLASTAAPTPAPPAPTPAATMEVRGIGGCGGAPFMDQDGGRRLLVDTADMTFEACATKCSIDPECIKVQSQATSGGTAKCYRMDRNSAVQALEPNGNPGWQCAFKGAAAGGERAHGDAASQRALLQQLRSAEDGTCPGMTYSTGSQCVACPAGTFSPPGAASCSQLTEGTPANLAEPWVLGQTWAGSYKLLSGGPTHGTFKPYSGQVAQIDMLVSAWDAATKNVSVLVSYNVLDLGCTGQYHASGTYTTTSDGSYSVAFAPLKVYFDGNTNANSTQCHGSSPLVNMELKGTVSADSLEFTGFIPRPGAGIYVDCDDALLFNGGMFCADVATQTLVPAPTYGALVPGYLGGCSLDCKSFGTLADAQAACSMEATCGGVTKESNGQFQLRSSSTATVGTVEMSSIKSSKSAQCLAASEVATAQKDHDPSTCNNCPSQPEFAYIGSFHLSRDPAKAQAMLPGGTAMLPIPPCAAPTALANFASGVIKPNEEPTAADHASILAASGAALAVVAVAGTVIRMRNRRAALETTVTAETEMQQNPGVDEVPVIAVDDLSAL